jgi:cell shape-determining protein MreD
MIDWYSDPASFQAFKIYLVSLTGLGKDAMHVHIGLAVFIIVRLLWRWRFGWTVAWLSALGAALTGEWLDIRSTIAGAEAMQPDQSNWHDLWNTMLWPSVLFILGRWLQPKAKPPQPWKEQKPLGDLADQPLE